MSSAITTSVPASYLALVHRFPLRPIRSDKDYEAASAVLDRLAVRDERTLDAGERDYLETLEMLVEAYDARHAGAIDNDSASRTPLEWLKSLMTAAGTTPAGLQRVLGMSQPHVSLILNGKRGISKESIAKLAAHFHVDPAVFIARVHPRKRHQAKRTRAGSAR